jgi:hypothetical protein
MPRDAGDLLVMALQRAQFPHGAYVVQLDQLVTTRRQEPVAVVIPRHLGHGILVPVQRAEA